MATSMSAFTANAQSTIKILGALFKSAATMDVITLGTTITTGTAGQVSLVNTLFGIYGAQTSGTVLVGGATFTGYAATSTSAEFAATLIDTMTSGTSVSTATKDSWKALVVTLLPSFASRGAAAVALMNLFDTYTGTDADLVAVNAVMDNRSEASASSAQTTAGATFVSVNALVTTVSTVTTDPATISSVSTQTGTNFTLTSSIDIVTGTAGNDTIVGDNNTSSAADQVNGGAGIDLLKLYDTRTLPAITNIEGIYLNSAGAAAAPGTFDASALSTVTLLSIENEPVQTNATGVADYVLTLAGTQSLALTSVTDATASAWEVNVAGASTITSNSIAVDGVTAAIDITGTGVATLTLTTLNNSSSFNLQDTGGALKTLIAKGDKGLTVDANALAANLTKVDASANTGGVTFTVDTATNRDVNFIGGSGNDAVRYAGTFLETDTPDGGAGTDTIGISNGAHITTGSGAKILNFETLDVRGGEGTYIMTRVAGITKVINSAATSGTAVVISDVGDTAAVEIGAALGAQMTVQQKDSGVGSPADTMTVTINAKAAVTTGSLLVIPDIEAVTLNSTSSGTSITHILSDATLAAATQVAFNASTAGLTVAAVTATSAVLFDASASAKAVSLTFKAQSFTTNSGIEVKGGAGSDTISFANVAAFATGQDSNLATPTYDQIKVTGGKGGDTITVKASIDSDQYTFVYAAGDSVTVVGATAGYSATATDSVSAIANNGTYADAAGNRLIIDTDVSATAVAAISTTAPTFGTTAVANAGDFYFYRDGTTTTDAYVYQDTNGNKVIDAGEFSVKLVGAGADHWANETLSIASGNLVIVTVA